MSALVVVFRSRVSIGVALCALLWCAGCGGSSNNPTVSVGDGSDAGDRDARTMEDVSRAACDRVEIDGDLVVERETHFTARYRMGEPYTKTIMLFGGESVPTDDVLSNAYIIGLDKMDALML